jgi:hypothetical protein
VKRSVSDVEGSGFDIEAGGVIRERFAAGDTPGVGGGWRRKRESPKG